MSISISEFCQLPCPLLEGAKEVGGLLVFGQSLGVLLQIRIDLRCVKIAMPDERLPAISISLDPTDDSSSCWVGHRLVVAPATNVFSLFLLLFRDIRPIVSFLP